MKVTTPFLSGRVGVGLLLLGTCGALSSLWAQIPAFDWVRTAGGPAQDAAQGVAVDSIGNVYVTGYVHDRAFIGTGYVGTSGDCCAKMFLTKQDSAGNYLWARSANLNVSDNPYRFNQAIVADPSGAVYVVGVFSGTTVFGSISLSASDVYSLYVVKYSASGSALWAVRAGPIHSGPSPGVSVTIASDGSVHVASSFEATASFGNTNMTSGGYGDICHAKYNSTNGTLIWVSKAGGAREDAGMTIAADGAANTYLAGQYEGPASFGSIALPGHPDIVRNGNYFWPSAFLAKYDTSGSVLWARQLTTGYDIGNVFGATTDQQGNCLLCGYLVQASYNGSYPIESDPRVFVAKYDSSGTQAWVRFATGSPAIAPFVAGKAITVDAAGNAYVAGFFPATINFTSTNLSTSGSSDIFIAKYDPSGNVLWAKQAGLVQEDVAAAIALDWSANIYVAGWFTDSANFDNIFVTANGLADAFIARLPAVVPVPPTIIVPPLSQAVLAESNATFSVTAGGTAPLAYQWQFNGTDLVGETNVTLLITNAQPANEGPYRVIVANSAGVVTSVIATLSLLLPPSILSQPQNQIVIGGVEARFSTSASGTLPLRYQWRINGSNLAGATGASLVIPSAQPGDAGNYSVVVNNSYGSITSSIATLTVRFALVVTNTGLGTVMRLPNLPDYPPNFLVSLTATPAAGHAFRAWSGDASGADNPLSITMTTNKSITANFSSTALSIGVEGSGTVSKSPDQAFYGLGDQVTLTALAGRWHAFTRWRDGPEQNPRIVTIGFANAYSAIFTPTTAVETLTFGDASRTAPVGMPALFLNGQFALTNSLTLTGSVEISMLTTFPNGTLLYSLDGSAPTLLSRLYDGTFELSRSVTLRAVAFDAFFELSWEADPVHIDLVPTYPLNLVMRGGGTVAITPPAGPFVSNTVVSIEATPATGWSFLQWLGDVVSPGPAAIVVMNRERCAEAVFGTSISTVVSGPGAVVVEPTATFYPYGAVVRLTAVPESGSGFALWGNTTTGTNNPLVLPVTNGSPIVSAAFVGLNAKQATLSVLANGRGNVAVSPHANRYPVGTSVQITALAEEGQEFTGWTADANGTNNPLKVVISTNLWVTANFTKRPRLTLFTCNGVLDPARVSLVLEGDPGTAYLLEASEELQHWIGLVTITNEFGQVRFDDTTTTSFRFYRARLGP